MNDEPKDAIALLHNHWFHICMVLILYFLLGLPSVVACRSGNGVGRINEVTLR